MHDSIQTFLREHGHAYDVVVPEELFEDCKADELHRSDRALPKDGPTYRDDRPRHSVHVTDVRGVDRGEKLEAVVVGHLEYFNPEYHPVLHAIIDYPLWYAVFYWNTARARFRWIRAGWKNRIREKNVL